MGKMKRCWGCGEYKPATPEFFHRHKSRYDGLNSLCKVCCAQRDKPFYRENRERILAKGREYSRTHPAQENHRHRRWKAQNREHVQQRARRQYWKNPEIARARATLARLLNPEKVRARNAVRDAIQRGELVRPERCPSCNRVAKVHAHHEDYSRPLDVQWLCARCHAATHHNLPIIDAA